MIILLQSTLNSTQGFYLYVCVHINCLKITILKNCDIYKYTYVCIIQIAVKREDAVTKEISRKLAEDKKMSKKEKDER